MANIATMQHRVSTVFGTCWIHWWRARLARDIDSSGILQCRKLCAHLIFCTHLLVTWPQSIADFPRSHILVTSGPGSYSYCRVFGTMCRLSVCRRLSVTHVLWLNRRPYRKTYYTINYPCVYAYKIWARGTYNWDKNERSCFSKEWHSSK